MTAEPTIPRTSTPASATGRARLVFGAAWALFWILENTVAVQDYLRDGGTALWQPLLWESSSALVVTCLLLLQRRLTRESDALLATPWRWFGRQFLWLPFNCLVFVPVAYGIRHAVYAMVGQVYTHRPWPQAMVYESLKVGLVFGIFNVILFGVRSYLRLLDATAKAEDANRLMRQAQLQRLTQQMQPHFLFNALNTISSLMHTDVERADAVLIRLGDVLRAALDIGERHETPLSNELDLLRAYAAVMLERFDGRASIAWDIDAGALACAVPAMSLQPLLENIFKHTVERRRQPVRIAITAARDGGRLLLRFDDDSGTLVENNGDNKGGVGLRNLRARLAAMHGGEASLTLDALQPAGVRAEMRLPCVPMAAP
jgi:two-component system LytT family sensor kinase